MKNLVAFVSILVCVGFVTAHMHIPPKTCYKCSASNITMCDDMMTDNCSNPMFPSFGAGDCYTAVGWYQNSASQWVPWALRGCADCSDFNAAKQRLDDLSDLSNGTVQWGFSIEHLNFMCCNETNCNDMTLTLPANPGDDSSDTPSMSSPMTQEVEEATTMDSGIYVNRLSPLGIVMVAIILLFK